MARAISDDWDGSGYRVLCAYGDQRSADVGPIVSWSGDCCGSGVELTSLDIAVIERKSNKAFVLIKLLQSTGGPRTIEDEIIGVLQGERIRFGDAFDLPVDGCTTLLVLGRSRFHYEKRICGLLGRVGAIKTSLGTRNASIGAVVVETFADETGLYAHLPSLMEGAFSGYFSKV